MPSQRNVETPGAAARCANHQCKHPLSAHSDGYGCDARILTVLDTEGNCPCVAFTTDPEDSWRNLRDYQGLVDARVSNEYDAYGKIIHEPRAQDGERLDYYLARVRPDIGDQAYWYAQCDAGRVQVKDKLHNGLFDRTRWYVEWAFGKPDGHMDLAPGERPRMRDGFCHIVKEG